AGLSDGFRRFLIVKIGMCPEIGNPADHDYFLFLFPKMGKHLKRRLERGRVRAPSIVDHQTPAGGVKDLRVRPNRLIIAQRLNRRSWRLAEGAQSGERRERVIAIMFSVSG